MAEDFTGVGPLGFTLSKQDWLERHATGSLKYDDFQLIEVHDAHNVRNGSYRWIHEQSFI